MCPGRERTEGVVYKWTLTLYGRKRTSLEDKSEWAYTIHVCIYVLLFDSEDTFCSPLKGLSNDVFRSVIVW